MCRFLCISNLHLWAFLIFSSGTGALFPPGCFASETPHSAVMTSFHLAVVLDSLAVMKVACRNSTMLKCAVFDRLSDWLTVSQTRQIMDRLALVQQPLYNRLTITATTTTSVMACSYPFPNRNSNFYWQFDTSRGHYISWGNLFRRWLFAKCTEFEAKLISDKRKRISSELEISHDIIGTLSHGEKRLRHEDVTSTSNQLDATAYEQDDVGKQDEICASASHHGAG